MWGASTANVSPRLATISLGHGPDLMYQACETPFSSELLGIHATCVVVAR
ncbi:hypothetical protein HOV93_02610 [Planctomycetes bacterium FF15]|uniref:Uncharacterized protein n=1 Tax=Bremerella alba TaxID=980252 RepID=A0A7V8V1B9_9BACT|nr:hypothetical protein [Bremerella alba]